MKRNVIMSFLVLGFANAGCALPHRSIQPAHNQAELDDLRFTHYLATVPVVTVNEGARAVLMLIEVIASWQKNE